MTGSNLIGSNLMVGSNLTGSNLINFSRFSECPMSTSR